MSAALERGPDMRQQILDTTARLLREHSYEATTVRAIAEQVGIKAGSIYHHFVSKDAIVAEVVNEGVRMVGAAVRSALATLPPGAAPREKVETAIRAHLHSSLQHTDYVSASVRTFPHLPPELRDVCREERRAYETIWVDMVAEAQITAVSPDAVRLLLLGGVNWAGEWYRPGRLSIDQLARDWTTIVFGPA